MRPLLVILVFVYCGFAAPLAHAQQVQNCTAEAQQDIELALSFVTDRLANVVNRMDSLSERQKNMFLVKWPSLKAVCRDTERRCRRSPDAKRHEAGSLTNRVRLCYTDTIRLIEQAENREAMVCDLVEVLVHEFGHASGIAVPWGHKNQDEPARQNDKIYAMGLAARGYCLEMTNAEQQISNSLLRGQSKAVLEKSCVKDAQCASGKCEAKTCVCQKDSQCGAGQKCRTPLIGKNYCE